MTAKFVHLHVHTEYSLVDSVIRIKPLMQAVAQGMPAVALTDLSNLFAMVKFYRSAISVGVKPIIGVEIWLQGDEPSGVPDRLVLLCQNELGYRNVCELVSRSYQFGQNNGRAVVQRQWLEGKTDGLIGLSGARFGDVGRALLADNRELALQRLAHWMGMFSGRFYLELHRTGRESEEPYIRAALEIAHTMQCPVVATNDVRFLSADDFDAHEARVCIHEGRTLADSRRPHHYSREQYLRSADEMCELFADIPEAVQNTVEIAKRCNLHITLGESVLPDFPVPQGMTEADFFRQQARSGLSERFEELFDLNSNEFKELKIKYEKRLEVELDVIVNMGFPGYFLIVADFIEWSRNNGVPVGPGRGSGAGSLVAYALRITDIDPLEYDLLFERFLNPERVSLPDFDVDFCMDGRDRVIQYVSEKYGAEKVSQIITYGSMAAKAVVRDVGRVLGHPYGFVDRIAKQVPFELGMTLDKALRESEDLKTSYDDDEDVKALIDLALSLEGLSRNAGKHAGGVVIAPSQLTDFSPLYCEADGGGLVTQFDKDDVEAIGLVKFDFLGLRTLTIIDRAVHTINASLPAAERVDVTRLPLNDEATFKLLQRYETTAVFQLESRGMKDLIKRLQPDCFEDIVALVALFRPGPLQSGMVDDFIERKKNEREGKSRKVDYLHPSLEGVLKPTYGVILYQEQVMQIAQVLSGYTLGGADMLRRAMGKKKPEVMAQMRSSFVEGAVDNNVEGDEAGHIFDLIEKFAGYGFNKSHSAAYALLSYQTAWLKTHYPADFMCAVLSADMDNTDKVVTLIDECRRMGLKITPPDVNSSNLSFTAVGTDTVRYGLGAIKGVGEAALSYVLEEREANGYYRDLDDFTSRMDLGRLNKRVMEALVRSGALDQLGPNRATLLKRLPDALKAAEQQHHNASAGQDDLFGGGDAQANIASASVNEAVAEWRENVRLDGERETLGLYLTGHPIEEYRDELAGFTNGRILDQCEKVESGSSGGRRRKKDIETVTAGLVVAIRSKNLSSGGKMGFVTLDDRSARLDVVIGPELFEASAGIIQKDAVLVVGGELGYDDFSGGYRVRANSILDINNARARYARCLEVSVDSQLFQNGFLERFAQTLEPHKGGVCPTVIRYKNCAAQAPLALGEEWKIKPCGELLEQLADLDDGCSAQLIY
ncbi:MAG: DNA polymerase III subunit alpha [Pseudomonadota bacterium]